jgi:hypothetical protein
VVLRKSRGNPIARRLRIITSRFLAGLYHLDLPDELDRKTTINRIDLVFRTRTRRRIWRGH